MPREILRPEYGEPLIFKLGHDPVKVEGIRGPQWRYFVNDDEAMLYLDQPAHEAIMRTEAHAGDELCLRKERVGRKTEWAADRVDEEPVHVEGEIRSASQQASRQRYEDSRSSSKEPNWVKSPEPTPTNGKVNGHANGKANGHGNGNGNGHHEPESQRPMPHAPGANAYAMALRSAIDAAIFGKQYAESKGLELKWTTEDIRCIAATLHIDQRKENQRQEGK